VASYDGLVHRGHTAGATTFPRPSAYQSCDLSTSEKVTRRDK